MVPAEEQKLQPWNSKEEILILRLLNRFARFPASLAAQEQQYLPPQPLSCHRRPSPLPKKPALTANWNESSLLRVLTRTKN
jgi:hypothetical protein